MQTGQPPEPCPKSQGAAWDGQQQLAAALAACSSLVEAPVAGETALHAANAAASALLTLADKPDENAATLQDALSTAAAWAGALVPQLPRWEVALGAQPIGPEKAALDAFYGKMVLGGVPPPRPNARRVAGAVASPACAGARLQAAGVLVLLDAALACLQALQPPQAPARGAGNAPAEPHPLERPAAEIMRRLEDTELPFAVRSSEEGGAVGKLATAAGFNAINACCSGLARLLRLATWRDWARPRPPPEERAEEEAEGALPAWGAAQEDWGQACRPVQLKAVMDTLYDAAAVLCFWAPRQGKPLGRTQWAAWDSCIELVEMIWGYCPTPHCVCDGELLSCAAAPWYGRNFCRYVALAPVLAYHAHLCQHVPEGRRPSELSAWVRSMLGVLSLLTEAFAYRIKGVAAGTCAGGPGAGFDAHGVSHILLRSAALLRQLPALQAELAAQAPAPGLPPQHRQREQQQLRQIGLMSAQLIAYSCITCDSDGLEGGPVIAQYGSVPLQLGRARCAFALQHLPLLAQLLLSELAASRPDFEAWAAERTRETRAQALVVQLCTAAEAAASTLPEQASAACDGPISGGAGLPGVLASLLKLSNGSKGGSMDASLESCASLEEILAIAAERAATAVQQQLALAALPCANAACCSLAGSSEAALPSRRCSGCRVSRFCSTLCSKQAWEAGHRAACKALAAAAAAEPAPVPPASSETAGVLLPGKRGLQCPVCYTYLAALDCDADGGAAHMQACAQARRERCAALQAAHGGDPAAAAAALSEVVWIRTHLQHEEQRRASLLAAVRADWGAGEAAELGQS
ncbi:hypothetical protein ABPG75_008237 [Micractinium tetrahymenae]